MKDGDIDMFKVGPQIMQGILVFIMVSGRSQLNHFQTHHYFIFGNICICKSFKRIDIEAIVNRTGHSPQIVFQYLPKKDLNLTNVTLNFAERKKRFAEV